MGANIVIKWETLVCTVSSVPDSSVFAVLFQEQRTDKGVSTVAPRASLGPTIWKPRRDAAWGHF